MTIETEAREAIYETSILAQIDTRLADNYYPLAGQLGYSMAVCALPSESLRAKINEVAKQIREKFPSHYYVPESYPHLTIANIGVVATASEIDRLYEQHNPALRYICRRTRPFRIIVEGVGHFPKCLFAQVFDESDEDTLDTLHDSIVNTLSEPDPLPFVPHMTMGYNNGSAYARDQYINTHFSNLRIGSDTIDTLHFTVFDATRGIYETPYEIVESYPLNT